MKTQKELIYERIITLSKKTETPLYFTTKEIADYFSIQRSNASSLLNELAREGLLDKKNTRPVEYSIAKENRHLEQTESFKNVIGSNTSLKNQVQLAKAALLYPDQILSTLLVGEKGTGKDFFAYTMYEFAIEMSVIAQDSEFIMVNCQDYTEINHLNNHVFTGLDSLVARMKKKNDVFLYLKYIDIDDLSFKKHLEQALKEGLMIVCSIERQAHHPMEDDFTVVIDLPNIKSRTLEERYQFIERFLTEEANKMNRVLQINAELLRNLLLYDLNLNIHQLKNDIRLGCANAFVREFNKTSDYFYVFLHDFPAYVRKGFLYYKKYKEEIESLIPTTYSYTFSENKVAAIENYTQSKNSIYDYIEKKHKTLRERGLSSDEINNLISIDLENDFQHFTASKGISSLTNKSIQKITDPKVVKHVEKFLNRASKELNRVFSNSTFYGLSMHLSSSLRRKKSTYLDLGERESFIREHFPKEFNLVVEWMKDIENDFNVVLPSEEKIFLTMFLTEKETLSDSNPTVLVAAHGDATATSLVQVSVDLLGLNNIHGYNLSLGKPLEEAYEEIKELVLQINQGAGILFIYDMGSLKTMIESISLETGITIKALEIPFTQLALEASRKASLIPNLEDLHTSVLNSYENSFNSIRQAFSNESKSKALITLCMTGEGTAVHIKNYLEENLIMENIDIIPLAISNKEVLKNHLSQIQEKQEVIGIIGTYNPDIYAIPFISIAQIFDTPVDKLSLLISSGTVAKPSYIDYTTIYNYLSEQMPDLDIQLIKTELPKTMRRINKLEHLSIDQELGMFIHIACNIYRLQQGEESNSNIRKQQIITGNKRIYYSLVEVFKSLEENFSIEFTDDDYANIIAIIKKI